MKAILIVGAALVAAGAVALVLAQDRPETQAQVPQALPDTAPPAQAELVDPGVIPAEEPAPQPELAVEAGYEVDPDGFVWEPLSFDKPQIKNNGDGTVTMKKLARVVEAGGQVREVPITVNAAPQQRRLPIRQRGGPKPESSDPPAESGADGQ